MKWTERGAIGPRPEPPPVLARGDVRPWVGAVDWRAAGLIAALALPLVVRDVYALHVLNTIGIYILLTTGLNLILGYSGQISVGHAAFYGVGAYTTALLTVKAGVNPWLALPAAGCTAGLFGVVIGPTLRLRGHVLAMATIAFGEMVRLILMNWVSFTNGPRGIHAIPPPAVGDLTLATEHRFYYLVFSCVVLNHVALRRLVRSRVGAAWRAIRDNEEAAQAVGIRVTTYKILAFVIGGVSAGIAGSLYAHLTTYVSPHTFTLHESVKMLAMIIVGGEGSLVGSIVGAVVLTLLGEYVRALQQYSLVPYGVLLLLMLIFAPRGVVGLAADAAARWRRRLGSAA